MKAYMSIWKHTGAYESIQEHRKAYRSIWKHIGAYESIQEHMKAHRSIWKHMGANGVPNESKREHVDNVHMSTGHVDWKHKCANKSSHGGYQYGYTWEHMKADKMIWVGLNARRSMGQNGRISVWKEGYGSERKDMGLKGKIWDWKEGYGSERKDMGLKGRIWGQMGGKGTHRELGCNGYDWLDWMLGLIKYLYLQAEITALFICVDWFARSFPHTTMQPVWQLFLHKWYSYC